MKIPNVHTCFFPFIILLLTACTQPIPTTSHSVSQESVPGYPKSPLIQPELALPITNRNATIRTGPSVTTERMLTVPRGTVLNVVGVNPSRDWYILDNDGWVATFLIDNAPIDLPIVVPPTNIPTSMPLSTGTPALPITNRNATIRTGPSVTTEQMLTAPKGTVLNIVGVNPSRDWYILENGGWVVAFMIDNAPTDLPIVVPESTVTDTFFPATLQPPATGGLPVEQAIQDVLDEVAQAMQTQDFETLEQLIDPDAASDWVYRYTHSIRPPATLAESDVQSANAGEISIELQRVMITNQWAQAAIIKTGQDHEGNVLHQTYTYQTLYNREGVGWQLTSPVPQAWGQQQELAQDCLKLTYYTFDEPYVRAAAPKIEEAYRLLEEDLAIPFCEESGPRALGIVPKILWETVAGEKIQSPLTFEFSLSFAATPEDFLSGYITDMLAHMLLESAYDNYGEEMSRSQLSHVAVQWEAEAAAGRSNRQRLLEQLSKSEEPIPLSQVLNPTVMISTGTGPLQRDLLSYFLKETYGRASFGPFVQAVFETDSADELTRAAFGLPLEVVEQAWQAWLFLSDPTALESTVDWQTYGEADGFFTIDYPPGWVVQETGSVQFHRIWQFNNPEISRSAITVVKYLTRIPTEMALEEWIAQTESQTFEFERLQSEPSEFNGLGAYVIHDRIKSPDRDSYITYIRCLETVWSIHLLDEDRDSTMLEEIYATMFDTLDLTQCHK